MVQAGRLGQRFRAASAMVLWLCTLLTDSQLPGQQPAVADTSPLESASVDASSNTSLGALLIWIARQNIPTTYMEKKNWGGTREIVTGLRLVGSGRKLRTAARRKHVNHGTWKMYRVSLKDPQEGFHIDLNRLQVTQENGLIFEAIVEARLETFARWSQWNRGVQLISLNALADADVRMHLAGKMTIRIDPRKLPPDVSVMPEVTSADLQLKSFRLRRISQLHGSLVHKIGDEARKIIESKLADKREDLVAKINKQIRKNEGKLRVSLRDYVQQEWARLINDLPAKKLR